MQALLRKSSALCRAAAPAVRAHVVQQARLMSSEAAPKSGSSVWGGCCAISNLSFAACGFWWEMQVVFA